MALLNPMLRRFRSRSRSLLLIALLAGATVGAVRAAEQHEVQAVFLLNLSRFIRWPETAFQAEDAPLVIGCFANAPIAGPLHDVARGELAERRPIAVRHVRTSADLEGCHIIFFSKSDTANLAQMLGPLRTKPVLTVGDAEGFLRLGGHVQLYNRGGQVRLRLDLRNLKRAELSASAPLLRVAEVTEN